MAAPIVLANRARMTCNAPGTSDFVFTGAADGHQSFESGGVVNGDRVYYGAETFNRSDWEVGLGTYNSATDTLVRDTVLSSSNSDSLVNFTGAVEVWVDAPKELIFENVREVTAAGDITVLDTDDVIIVNKSSGAATAVNLVAVANRNPRRPLTIIDGKGDANSNPITVTPSGAETIVGLTTWAINLPYGSVRLRALSSGSKWLIG